MFKKDPFGHRIFFKKQLIRIMGFLTYPRFNWRNTTDIQGAEVLQTLRDKNVLIVSNHQTYFADVIFMYHVIQASLAGHPNNIKRPGFIKCKKSNLYYVAAEETMKGGFLPKLFAQGGAITVKRSWRKDGEDVNRMVDKNDTSNIYKALHDGWVISFPQGTTKPFAPGRRGTAHIIKEHKPVVVPVIINGFRRAFDKKGLFIKKKNTTLSLWISEPLDIDFEADKDDIMNQIMDSIMQSPKYDLVGD